MTERFGPGVRRVFVACPMPSSVVERVADLQSAVGGDELRPSIRWVRPEGVHLTIRFLGSLAPEPIAQIMAVLDRVAATILMTAIRVGGVRAFPSIERPRVLWLAVHDTGGRLDGLARELEAALAEARIAPDGRPFRAHLTIGRADGSTAAAGAARALVDLSAGPDEDVVLESLCLFESLLGDGAARYDILHRVGLAARNG